MIWKDQASITVGETKAFTRFDKKIHFYEKTENGCIEIAEWEFNERKYSEYVEVRQTLMSYLLQMGMEEEEILKMIPFIDTPEMLTEMISVLKEKNFRMSNREIWNAAGMIVKKHL